MTIYKHDFLDRMAIGKQNAMNRRNRGHGASSHGSWTHKYSDCAPIEMASHSYAVAVIVAGMRDASAIALEDYLRAAFPERYEAFE